MDIERRLRCSALVALLLLTSVPLAAQAPVTYQVNPAEVVRFLSDVGFSGATLDEDGDVDVRMQDYDVLILVGSSNGRYLLAKFAITGSKGTMAMMNEWNRTHKYSRAYIDVDGDAMLESDLNLEGGVTAETIKAFLRTFDLSLREFIQTIS